ncbi:hypothetical protein PHG31p17 [Aeromonas phage 31]|uniref:Uncharacterized protein PHG31ORF018c n=1 Tax=Aeromonas phage 31 TaxID=321023 RepID=Q56EZ4_9CAUD|nr:hypothetical protein PHG31p17 [Aeromonas phage 31]AAX63506.1 hypothetical protein PHG31p17 [Aeromonas phage 31]APU00912.1 hypothetical protein [Aeromonas phage 31.2]
MTPEAREFLAFCSLAFKLQPVKQGIYHRGFISYGSFLGSKREISTPVFCALARAVRKTKPGKVYIDDHHKIRAYIDVRWNLHIGVFADTKKVYSATISMAMQEQLNMRQHSSGFRWIQKTKRGPKWIMT